MTPARALSGSAFATLLLIALMMAGNHVAARVAFNHGADVATAVVFRSAVTALVLVALLAAQGVRVQFSARHKRMLPLIGLLIGAQSLCLYSSVARLPVALALLAFNTYPIWAALWSWAFYKQPPERPLLLAMPVILVWRWRWTCSAPLPVWARRASGVASAPASVSRWRPAPPSGWPW